MELFCPGNANSCAARRRGERIFYFFDPDKTGDLAGESREPEKICETGQKPGAEMGRVDITRKEAGKGRKWAQVAQTKDRAKARRINRHGITSKKSIVTPYPAPARPVTGKKGADHPYPEGAGVRAGGIRRRLPPWPQQ